jgi:DNA invertase Pin-like site-specific DNA recombinase
MRLGKRAGAGEKDWIGWLKHLDFIPHKKQLSKEEIKNLKDLFHLGINKNYMRRTGCYRSSKYQNWKDYFKTWDWKKK